MEAVNFMGGEPYFLTNTKKGHATKLEIGYSGAT